MKNILYIHGLNSDKNSYTGNKLKELFPSYHWVLESFDLLDVVNTTAKIIQLLKENNIDTVVSSSLGCVYNLFLKKVKSQTQEMVNKIVINPCCLPSKELPRIGSNIPMAREYCEAMEFNIYQRHEENSCKKLFGIFSKNDELFQYHDFFVEKYGNSQDCNAIWVEGGHAQLAEEELKKGMLQAIAYFEKMESSKVDKEPTPQQTNMAISAKPYHLPQNRKPILYFDMDGTLVDFDSGKHRLDPLTKIKYNGCIDEAPHIFSLMDPMPGAVEAFYKLSKYFDSYILTTASWRSTTACDDKKQWVKHYLGQSEESPAYKRLIISHRKELNRGDFLIDDRPTKCGADKFEGVVIPIGSKDFPDWAAVLQYLLADKK